MGYQQSFVKFTSKEALKVELKKYRGRDNVKDDARVYGVTKVIKGIQGKDIKKGQLMAIVGGERYAQRSEERILEYMGLEEVDRVIFLDNVDFVDRSNGDLTRFLNDHFLELSENEVDELLS